MTIESLDAIAVSVGPGSYTGLRIGVSTVKGLAFASKLPIIGLDTLSILCGQIEVSLLPENSLICPMIDARRMEVYCRIQNLNGEMIWETRPLVVEEDSFAEFEGSPLYFFGDGSAKCQSILYLKNHHFIENKFPDASNMGDLAINKFRNGIFEDLAYLEPNYLKTFRTNKPAVKFKI